MTKIISIISQLTGQYEIINTGSFKNSANGLKLFIGRSKQPNKPNELLLYLDTETNQRKWVSGLFPVGKNYCFDKSGKRFMLTIDFDNGTAEIFECIECQKIIHTWYVKNLKSHK